jgi:hypothetical protein
LFRLKDGEYTRLLTGSNGNAAALIGGVTLYLAANIGFEGESGNARSILEEAKLRWKNKILLIVNKISQVGGLILVAVNSCLRLYRDN